MSMKLIPFYEAILQLGAMTADDKGFVSTVLGDHKGPATVGGRRLVLPTPERQKAGGEVEFFHPLGEHAVRPETNVLTAYRKSVNIKLNYTIGVLGQTLLTLAASTDEHKKFTPSQLELLTALPEANEKTMTTFTSLVKAMGHGNIDRCFVNIFLKPKGKIKDTVYRRAAIVSFPLYEELSKGDKKVFDVTVGPKERRTIMALLTFMFAKIAQPQAYDRGSDSSIAPFLEAFLEAVAEIAIEELNPVIDDFSTLSSGLSELRFEDDWLTPFKTLSSFNKEIEMIPLYGDLPAKTETASPNVQAHALHMGKTAPSYGNAATAAAATLHVEAKAPVASKAVSDGVEDFDTIMARSRGAQASQNSGSSWGSNRQDNGGWNLSGAWGGAQERAPLNVGVAAREQPPEWERVQRGWR